MKEEIKKGTKIIFICLGVVFLILGLYACFGKNDFLFFCLSVLLGLSFSSLGIILSKLEIPSENLHLKEGDVEEEGL